MLPESEILDEERRRRLAAERLLYQKSKELLEVNEQLSKHAYSLSDKVSDHLAQNEGLRSENNRISENLNRATQQADLAEARLWGSLQAIPEGFAIFDSGQCLTAANPSFFHILGGVENLGYGVSYDALLEFAVDEGLIDTGEQDPDAWIEQMIYAWQCDPIPVQTMRLYNGAYLELTATHVGNGDIACVVKDMTETLTRQEELRVARDQAQEASKAKSAFFAKMSHEIRTPMNGVVGMADLLLEDDLSEEHMLYAQTIRNSAEALVVIINDILDFSKLEADRMELREETFDLEAMIVEVLRLMQSATKGKELDFLCDYPLTMPKQFRGDAGRLRQVLTNLIGNAVKFTEDGYVAIRAFCAKMQSAEGKLSVTLQIEDSGLGIPSDKLSHIFGDFNQVEDTESRRYDGAGLGLAISRGIVEKMGGNISVTSELGEGAVFALELPLHCDEQEAEVSPSTFKHPIFLLPSEDIGYEITLARFQELNLDLRPWSAQAAGGVILAGEDFDEAMIAQIECPVLTVRSSFLAPPEKVNMTTLRHPVAGADLLAALHACLPEIMSAPERKRPQIIAAEDNKTNQLVLKKMLETVAADITYVEDGMELLEAFQDSQSWDLILTDISMPRMDGKECVRKIRSIEALMPNKSRAVPIIAMTAHAMEEDEASIKEAGVDFFLTKPLKKAILLNAIFDACPTAAPLA